MILECTKSLLDYAKLKPADNVTIPDEFFEWSAGLVTLNRRKTLVVTNIATRCCFVLYGVNSKELRKLDTLLTEGVRAFLESEYVKPEIIGKYLDELGQEVVYTKNLSRAAAARCVKCCKYIEYNAERFTAGDIFQKKNLPVINADLFAEGKEYVFAYERLREELRKRYGDEIFSCEKLELEVKIEGLECERVLAVPSDFDFVTFHNVLQAAFEWQDCHLHQFIIEADKYGRPTKIIEPAEIHDDDFCFMERVKTINSEDVTIGEIFGKYKKIVYEYDFGDDWIHEITLKKAISDSSDPDARCLKAKGDAPVEDSGGVGGFIEMQRIMKNPSDPEYRETVEWLGEPHLPHADLEEIDRSVGNVWRY